LFKFSSIFFVINSNDPTFYRLEPSTGGKDHFFGNFERVAGFVSHHSNDSHKKNGYSNISNGEKVKATFLSLNTGPGLFVMFLMFFSGWIG
jgi:hypothetical protein